MPQRFNAVFIRCCFIFKYYENRNKSVLVLCPKKLAENWNTYKDNYVNNPIAADRLNYDVLFHTDLSRSGGTSNGLDLDRLNWGNYDLVVIDESHNFRNGAGTHANTQENRYIRLMDRVIRAGVRTKVLMLSATLVNNRFTDLKNQLAIAYEGNPEFINEKLDTKKPIDEIFRQAQKAFNIWSKLDPEVRTTDALLRTLDFDFFELLDSVTIARSRRHIEKYYDTAAIGQFPERLKPISLRPSMTDLSSAINYNQIFELLTQLSLCIYTPSNYIFPSKIAKYIDLTHNKGNNLTQQGREQGIRRLMSINLLKRLESSVYSFHLTLTRILDLITDTIEAIDDYEKYGQADIDMVEALEDDFDLEDSSTDYFTVGKKVKIDLADMDYKTWRTELRQDAENLELLTLMIADITPEHDLKLQNLLHLLDEKMHSPINEGNKKVLIFSAFSDTAEYLYDQVAGYVKKKYGLDTAVITGSIDGRTTIKGLKATLNNVLTCFSPISKGRDVLMPGSTKEIDILIATDCISEGQNLQDCDYLVNYDIHWNPVRIIQRFGRIDRIGSQNKVIQLVNFWPDMTLDEYINLKSRVETRMKISVMTSTGDDDLINPEEKGDLEYRKQQLKRLQEEVVDMEDMSTGMEVGETREAVLPEGKVSLTLTGVMNRVVPEASDEMVEKLGLEGVHTVAAYRAYLLEQQKEAAFQEDSYDALNHLMREVISGSEFVLDREDWEEPINRELDRCRTLCRQEGMVLEEMTPEQFNGRIPVKSYHELVAMLQYEGWDKLCRYLLGCLYAGSDGFRTGEAEYGKFIADYVRSWHVSEENAREANPYDSFIFNEYAGHAYTVLKEYIRKFY